MFDVGQRVCCIDASGFYESWLSQGAVYVIRWIGPLRDAVPKQPVTRGVPWDPDQIMVRLDGIQVRVEPPHIMASICDDLPIGAWHFRPVFPADRRPRKDGGLGGGT